MKYPRNVEAFIQKWQPVEAARRRSFWKEFRKAANAYVDVHRLGRLAGLVPLSEAECIARAGLNDAVMAKIEKDKALRKARALTVLASDMVSVFSDKDAIVTEERVEAWRKRLSEFSEPNKEI